MATRCSSACGLAADPVSGELPALRIKVQILCGDEIAFGPGKAQLLDGIARGGSISAAARAMDMSYRRAWLLVDAMNRCWSAPLVETRVGGVARGGGAKLTEMGQQVLANYRALQGEVGAAQNGAAWAALQSALLVAPKTHQSA